MHYDKLSKLVVFDEIEGNGKLTADDYCAQILDRELFDFWMTSMKELSDVAVMEYGAPYHRSVASLRRMQYEKDSWIS